MLDIRGDEIQLLIFYIFISQYGIKTMTQTTFILSVIKCRELKLLKKLTFENNISLFKHFYGFTKLLFHKSHLFKGIRILKF